MPQHPPPDWADNSETGREGPAIQGSGSGHWRLCVHKQSSEKKELPQTSNKACTPLVHWHSSRGDVKHGVTL